MLLLYPYAFLYQILTENVTQSIRNMLKTLLNKKKPSYEASFSNKTKTRDFLIFAMSQRVIFFWTCPCLMFSLPC